MELNLRPVSVVKAERQAAQRPYLVTAGLCVLGAVAAWWQYYERATVVTQEAAQSLEQKAAPLKNLETKIKTARADIANLEALSQPLLHVTRERDYWVNVLADLNQRLPKEHIWLTAFETPTADAAAKAAQPPPEGADGPANRPRPRRGEEVRSEPPVIVMVRGLYLSADAGNNAGPAVVDEFIAKLKESPYVEPIEDPGAGYQRASDDTPEWAFKFALPLKMKNPISLR
jgi:hypothetical protein